MKTKTWINLLVVLVLLVSVFGVLPSTREIAQAATIVRVKPGGSTSAGCGSTWGTACELQTAFTAAGAGTEIWVAAGTYKPGTNREDTFQLKSGVELYGGFAGTETSREERDWISNLTVLSGEIGNQNDLHDNIYSVVTGSGVDSTSILDGLTITGGAAHGSYWINDRGGGMVNVSGNPSLNNIKFIRNSADMGGGIYNQSCNPILTNVTFRGNYAHAGGGMYNFGSSPSLTNVIFTGNTVSAGRSDYGGGGIYNFGGGSNPSLTNVTISGNSAQFYGGGVYNWYSNPTIVNTIVWGNTAGVSGPQIFNDENSSLLIRYSDIEGGCVSIPGNECSGGGNIDADPLFAHNPNPGPDGDWFTVDDDYGDLRQRNMSPVIDAGDNTAPGLAGITYDLDIKPRFYNVLGIADTGIGLAPVVDMGAYEKHAIDVPMASDDFYNTDKDTPIHIAAPGILANDSDPDGDPLNAVLDDGPNKGSLSFNTDGSFDYIPELNYIGVVTFKYHVSDDLLVSNSAEVTISVNLPSLAPVAVNDNYTATEEEMLFISPPGVLENDSDLNSDQLSAVLESGPSKGTLTLHADGSFYYMPEPNYYGIATFTYHATDGLLNSNPATVTIMVNNVNDQPLANNDTYSTPKNLKLLINTPGVLMNDNDQDDDSLVAVLESMPYSGTLSLHPDGSFEYQPEKDFRGLVTFEYRASDGLVLSNIATASIKVGPPIAFDDNYTTIKNELLTIDWPGVLANDSDPYDGVLSANLESEPTSGFLSLNPGGDFTYQPEADYIGVVTFTYTAESSQLFSNIATVTINIVEEREVYLPVIIHQD